MGGRGSSGGPGPGTRSRGRVGVSSSSGSAGAAGGGSKRPKGTASAGTGGIQTAGGGGGGSSTHDPSYDLARALNSARLGLTDEQLSIALSQFNERGIAALVDFLGNRRQAEILVLIWKRYGVT